MAVMDRLKEAFTTPATTLPAYECVDCGRQFEADRENCPECDGDVREFELSHPVYWDTMM